MSEPKKKVQQYNQCVTNIPKAAFDKLSNSQFFKISGISMEEMPVFDKQFDYVKVRFRLAGVGDTEFKRRIIAAITTALTHTGEAQKTETL